MITRMQMPRQLRNKGGITNAVPREKYGLGSKLKDRFRKLIPNELADIAVKAAPFVAPFNPGIAGLMRGIGRFDQRGSISDALKQGAATFGFGKAAGFLGGAEGPGGMFGKQTFTKEGFRQGPVGRLFQGETPGIDSGRGGDSASARARQVANLGTDQTKPTGLIKSATDKIFENIPFGDKLKQATKEKLLVGSITSGVSALYSYFTGEFEPQEPGETVGEYMARRKERVKSQMRQFMDSYYTPLRNPEYAAMSDEEKDNFIDGIVGQTELEGTTDYQGMATGGRVELQQGGIMPRLNELGTRVSSAEEMLQDINQRLESANTTLGNGKGLGGLPSGTLPSLDKIHPDFKTGQPMAQLPASSVQTPDPFFGKKPSAFEDPLRIGGNLGQIPEQYKEGFADYLKNNETSFGFGGQALSPVGLPGGGSVTFGDTGSAGAFRDYLKSTGFNPPGPLAQPLQSPLTATRGGMGSPLQTALGLAKGGMPTGIMRTNKAGVMERDYRDEGGFVPVGIKEKADDVPAMLSKNEFVFTADAVRGAGNGSIEKGAQRMYNTMKNLEKRVV